MKAAVLKPLYRHHIKGVNTLVNSAKSKGDGVEEEDDLFSIDVKSGAEDEI